VLLAFPVDWGGVRKESVPDSKNAKQHDTCKSRDRERKKLWQKLINLNIAKEKVSLRIWMLKYSKFVGGTLALPQNEAFIDWSPPLDLLRRL
jgi:hypothetical protein